MKTKQKKAVVAKKRAISKKEPISIRPSPASSIFHNRHTADVFPTIRAALTEYFSSEYKGADLKSKVDAQVRFLHPGDGAA